MPKAATTDEANPILHPDEAPEVQQARATLDASLNREASLDSQRRRYEAALDPWVDMEDVSEDFVLEATEKLAAVRVEHAWATRERRQAEAAWHHARDAERERLRRRFHDLKRPLVQRLDALLMQAAVVSRELAEVEDRQRALTGDWSLDGLSWHELAAPSPLKGSRVSDWRSAAVEAKLLA